jgi:hypothetical protein
MVANPDLTKNWDPDWNPDFRFRSGFNPDFRFTPGIGLNWILNIFWPHKYVKKISFGIFFGKIFYWITFLPFKKLIKMIKILEIAHFFFSFASCTPIKNSSQ